MKLNTNILASESNVNQMLDSTIRKQATEENEFTDNNLYFNCFYFDAKNKTVMSLPKNYRVLKNKHLKSVNIK